MPSDDLIIKPTSDLFIAALWSAPKNEPILRSLINGVMTDAGLPAVRKTTVLNPFNVQEFPVDKQIRLDVRVEDETGALYDVEVQTDSHPGYNRVSNESPERNNVERRDCWADSIPSLR